MYIAIKIERVLIDKQTIGHNYHDKNVGIFQSIVFQSFHNAEPHSSQFDSIKSVRRVCRFANKFNDAATFNGLVVAHSL